MVYYFIIYIVDGDRRCKRLCGHGGHCGHGEHGEHRGHGEHGEVEGESGIADAFCGMIEMRIYD